MSKTPEEIKKEYVKQEQLEYEESSGAYYGFLAGYKAAQQWISVKDRLPEEGVWVLGYYLIYENDIYDVGVVKRFVHTWAEANLENVLLPYRGKAASEGSGMISSSIVSPEPPPKVKVVVLVARSVVR